PIDGVYLAATGRTHARLPHRYLGRVLDLPILRGGARRLLMRKPDIVTSADLILLALLLVCVPTQASAHIVSGEANGFVSGFEHPISGLDHIIAMVAVGLWGAQLGKPAIWLLPVTFPLIMACGGFLGLIGVPLLGS